MLHTCPAGCWVACLALSLMTVIVNSSAAFKHDPVKWSGLNPLFRESDNLKISVNVGDEMDFLCPTKERVPEYYKIYQVTEEEYENCHVKNLDDHVGRQMKVTKVVINCNDPQSFRYFRFQFLPMSPLGGNFDFQPGLKYYFLTTSTGEISGINLLENGACREKNMKLTIEVGQRLTPTIRPPQVSQETQSTRLTTSTTRLIPTTSQTTRSTSSTTSSTTTTSSTITTSQTTSSTRRPNLSTTRSLRLSSTVKSTKSEERTTTGKPPTSNSNSDKTTSAASSQTISLLWTFATVLICILHCKYL